MSAELIIVPVALAFLAVKAARALELSNQQAEGEVFAWRVTTIISDRPLLMAALKDLGL